MAKKLSPVPVSEVSDKSGKLSMDWNRWFLDVFYFVSRTLNSYDGDKSGTATLVAGTVTVANVRVTATTKFRLTAQNEGAGNIGDLYVSNLNVGVGFTIKSGNSSDNRQVFYELVEVF